MEVLIWCNSPELKWINICNAQNLHNAFKVVESHQFKMSATK